MVDKLKDSKIIFPGEVISNQDPLFLGRVRAKDKTKNFLDIVGANQIIYLNETKTDLAKEYWWDKEKDPFVFNSLLPIELGTRPKEGEYINIIYMNKDVNYQDQYYIQPPPSQITNIGRDVYESAVGNTGQGSQNKSGPALKDTSNKTAPESFGVFPEPNDTAILGRSTSDLIIRDDIESGHSSIMLRSGKCETLKSNTKPLPYDKRAFIQLSDFSTTINPPDSFSFNNVSEDEQLIRYLIEWNVLNLENQFDSFIFNLTIYELAPKDIFTTSNFNENTPLGSNAKLFKTYTFYNKTKNDVVKITNKLLKGFKDGTWNLPDSPKGTISNQFPFAFRANPLTYKWFDDPTTPQFANLSLVYPRIRISPASILSGFGLQANPEQEGPPTKSTPSTSKINTSNANRNTFGVQGANKLFLLSHNSSISDKGVIDLSNSIYGLSQQQIMSEVYPKTEPMVRGEQLMKLLDLMVKFMIAHVHPFHGVPPVPTASDGTTSAQILTELQNAPNNILNQNIRIN